MEPFAQTLFCDDIRAEVGDKMSLMGVYRDILVLESIPHVLPKLGMMISLFQGCDAASDEVTFKVFLGEEELFASDPSDISLEPVIGSQAETIRDRYYPRSGPRTPGPRPRCASMPRS